MSAAASDTRHVIVGRHTSEHLENSRGQPTRNCNAMPRSNDAKQWQPDAYGQKMIDRIVNYVLVSERCTVDLNALDPSLVKELWPQVQAKFLSGIRRRWLKIRIQRGGNSST